MRLQFVTAISGLGELACARGTSRLTRTGIQKALPSGYDLSTVSRKVRSLEDREYVHLKGAWEREALSLEESAP